MEYIKNDYKGIIFDTELTQVFKNKPTTMVDNNNLIKLRHEKHISDSDMKIVKFLYDYRFATLEILADYLDKNREDVYKDLSRLIKHRVVNAFGLVKAENLGPGVKIDLPMDAKLIYCLDIGGKVLVGHFHNYDTSSWYSTETMRGPEKIGEDLATNLFYLSLLKYCNFDENKDNFFKLCPKLQIGKSLVVPSFSMKIVTDKNTSDFKYYIGDVVRRAQFPLQFREHLAKLDSVTVTNAWKKYFHDVEKVPAILFICEDDAHALEVGKMICGISSIDPTSGFRLTTDERLKKGLGEKGAFLAYDPNTDSIVEKKMSSFKKA